MSGLILTPVSSSVLPIPSGSGRVVFLDEDNNAAVSAMDALGNVYALPAGAAGAQGDKGDKGDKGDTGNQGGQGVPGMQGSPGSAGLQGLNGDKGDKGDTGAAGAAGAQGLPGAAGQQGEQGAKGDKGDKGNTGDTGVQGLQGIPGQDGAPGLGGQNGAAGAQGAQGVQGDPGNQGIKGNDGAAGARGAQGAQGVQGVPGAAGAAGTVITAGENELITGILGGGVAALPAGAVGDALYIGPAGLVWLKPVMPSRTWANRGAASGYPAGYQFRASDVGISPGVVFVSDGAQWLIDGVQVLGRSTASIALGAVTTEVILATVNVLGGVLGLNSGLRLTTLWRWAANANTKSVRARLNAGGGLIIMNDSHTGALGLHTVHELRNCGSAAVQRAHQNGSKAPYGESSNAQVFGAIDTAVTQPFLIQGQKAVAGDLLELSWWTLELVP